MIDSNVIDEGTIFIQQGQNKGNCHKYRKYNESDISLDFHVVFGMERPKVVISFVRSKVGFHLTLLKYILFYIYKNNIHQQNEYIPTSKYIPTDMYTYQHKEIRSILKYLSII